MKLLVIAGLLLWALPAASAPDLTRQFQKCWNPPHDMNGVEIEVLFEIDAAGELIDMPQSSDATAGDVRTRQTAQAAINAVRRCAPYNAPEGQHRITVPLEASAPR